MKKITFKTIKMTASFILLLCATFKADAQTFTTGSQVGGTGDGHYIITTKDFNGDGYDDIASNDGNNNMRIILSNGSGGFNAPVTIGSGLWAYAADDLDNDGDIDIVASSSQYNTPGFYIYKNNGSGSFTLQSSTPTNITFSNYIVGSQVSDLVIFDANGDGKKDIVLIPYLYSTNNSFDARTKQFLFLNTTSGSSVSFSQNAIITTNQIIAHGMAADIDKDGDIDLVLDGTNGNTTEVFKNNGTGSFSFSGYAPGYSGGQFFYDWNNDGNLDIMVMDDYNGYGLRVKLNDGTGNFASGLQLLATGNRSNGTGFLADMNGDGLVDAVYRGTDVNGNYGYINIYTNTGCGFSATPNISSAQLTNNANINIAKIDANHDGKPDVFVMGGGTNKTFLNNIATATPPVVSTIIGVTNGSRCGDGNVMLKAGANNGGNITWWDAASGGNQVATGNYYYVSVNSSNTTQSYWVDASLNGCTSDRIKVLAAYKGAVTSSTSNVNVCVNQLPYTWNGTNYSTSGTYAKTLTNASGCDSVATLNLTAGSPTTPSVSIQPSSSTICSADDITFNAIGANAGSSPIYTWYKNNSNAGSGSTINFLAGTLSTNDTISCLLTSNNTCQTIATVKSNILPITVLQSPVIGVSTVSTPVLCSFGSSTTVYNSNTQGGGVWVSSNENSATVTTVNGAVGVVNAVGNDVNTLTYVKRGTNGCTSKASVVVTVAIVETPNAIAGATSVCKGATTNLSTTTTGGTWSSPSASIATVNASGAVTGQYQGSATIYYTVSNAYGCKAATNTVVTVNAIPGVPTIQYASAVTPNPQRGAGGAFCVGDAFNLVGSPVGGAWSSTTPSVVTMNASSGLMNIISAGAATIKYTTTAFGCSNSRSVAVTVAATCPLHRGVAINNEKLKMDNDFTIYPNPARTSINLNIKTIVGAGTIVVTDLYGKQVKTQALSMGNNAVDISNLAKGFYLVSIITEQGKTTKKLVVE